MSLEKQLQEAMKDIRSKDLKASLSSEHPITIVVEGVSDDMHAGSEVVRSLRANGVPYGKSTFDYDPDRKTLTVGYSIISKAKPAQGTGGCDKHYG